jgi:hypothetical protein
MLFSSFIEIVNLPNALFPKYLNVNVLYVFLQNITYIVFAGEAEGKRLLG